jgi:hypothetical protein
LFYLHPRISTITEASNSTESAAGTIIRLCIYSTVHPRLAARALNGGKYRRIFRTEVTGFECDHICREDLDDLLETRLGSGLTLHETTATTKAAIEGFFRLWDTPGHYNIEWDTFNYRSLHFYIDEDGTCQQVANTTPTHQEEYHVSHTYLEARIQSEYFPTEVAGQAQQV